MGPYHMVTDLLDIMIAGWRQNSDVLDRGEYYSEFETQFGKSHKILNLPFRFENEEASPRWTHGPVPDGGHEGQLQWLPVS